MKRFLFISCLLMLVQIVAAQKFYPGIITYTSGRSEQLEAIEMPVSGMSAVHVSKTEKCKPADRLEIQLTALFSIELWSKAFPSQHTIFYSVSWHQGKKILHAWAFPLATNPYGTLYACYPSYVYNKKSGIFDPELSYTDGQPDPVPCVLVRTGEAYGTPVVNYVGEQLRWAMPVKKLAELFADRPAIAEALLNKGYKPEDIQRLLNDLAK